MGTQIACTDMLTLPIGLVVSSFSLQVVYIVIKSITFLYMLCLMKKHTNYEFNAERSRLIWYFVLDLFSYVIIALVYFQERWNNKFGTKLPNDAWRYALLPFRVFYLLNIHQLLTGAAIIYLKGSEDIIQAVSKLGPLYIIS